MATPRYVARKVGDRYELVRVDPEEGAAAAMWAVVGGGVATAGLRRGGLLGKLALLAGVCMIYRALTGRNPVDRLVGWLRAERQGRPELAPSYQNDYRRKAGQLPADRVEEESMESFPASDPPGFTRSELPK
jgi:hypothetical protein